ncbi:MAG: hypothetical protein ACOX28_00825 [Bacilli bacterium]|jgi:hypothetical protein
MSNALGYTITALSIVAILTLFIVKEIFRFKKIHPLASDIMSWAIVFIPVILMALIDKWRWDENYLNKIGGTTNAEEALVFSPFHIVSIILMVVISVYVVVRILKVDRYDENKYLWNTLNRGDYTMFKIGCLLFLIEIYKQISFLTLFKGYQWYGFPYQFCSSPLYILLIAPFIKNEKVKNAFYSFTGIFVLVAALSVMVTGQGIFTSWVSISIHTMIWHGLMVVAGVYIAFYQRVYKSIKNYLAAITVLLGLIVLAQILNIIFHYADPSGTKSGSVDLFFISPFQQNTNMPVLSDWRIALQNNLGLTLAGILFTLIYLAVFSFGGLLIWAIEFGIYQLVTLLSGRPKNGIKQKEEVA